jgi:hypothetical protein
VEGLTLMHSGDLKKPFEVWAGFLSNCWLEHQGSNMGRIDVAVNRSNAHQNTKLNILM